MIKKFTILLALVGGFAIADIPQADAWPYRRVAPVRRVLAPPYPVARGAYYARPYVGRSYYGRPYATGYRGPAYYNGGYGYGGYGPGVGGGVYFGF
jgi:hypothetical protein